MLGLVAAGTIAQALLRTLTPPFGLLIAAYSLGPHAPRRQALVGIGMVVVSALAALAAVDALTLWTPSAWPSPPSERASRGSCTTSSRTPSA